MVFVSTQLDLIQLPEKKRKEIHHQSPLDCNSTSWKWNVSSNTRWTNWRNLLKFCEFYRIRRTIYYRQQQHPMKGCFSNKKKKYDSDKYRWTKLTRINFFCQVSKWPYRSKSRKNLSFGYNYRNSIDHCSQQVRLIVSQCKILAKTKWNPFRYFSLRNNTELVFRNLSITFELLFYHCDENDQDVRLAAEENLNKLIKVRRKHENHRINVDHHELEQNVIYLVELERKSPVENSSWNTSSYSKNQCRNSSAPRFIIKVIKLWKKKKSHCIFFL